MTLTLEEMEKRLKVLEDIEEIKQMHIRYILDLNHQNFEGMIDCFTDDAVMDYWDHREGKEEIAKFFRKMAADQRKNKAWKGGQILLHPLITVDGDTAKGNWTWYRLTGLGTIQKFTSDQGLEIPFPVPFPGFYTMEYRRVNGKWKMSKFHLTHNWPGKQWPKRRSTKSILP
jgi:hypothetical protein